MDRAADVNGAEIVRERRKLGERLVDGRFGGAIQDHTERSVLGMLPYEDDGAPEVGVDERGACDEKVTLQRLHGHNHGGMEGISREIRLVARPQGFPGEDLFEVAETPIPDPGEGQLVIRNAYFSVDLYMRPRMNDVRSYVSPFTLGEAMTGGAVGGQRPRATPGMRKAVPRTLGWRAGAFDGSGLERSMLRLPRSRPRSASSVCGFTAWYGLFAIGEPEGRDRFVLEPPGQSEVRSGRWRRPPAAE